MSYSPQIYHSYYFFSLQITGFKVKSLFFIYVHAVPVYGLATSM